MGSEALQLRFNRDLVMELLRLSEGVTRDLAGTYFYICTVAVVRNITGVYTTSIVISTLRVSIDLFPGFIKPRL